MVIVMLYLFFSDVESKTWDGYEVTTRVVDGREVKLLVADNQEKTLRGLMYVRKLDGYDGMLFIFPRYAVQAFWNQNTYLDLDVYWLQGGEIIGKDRLPPITETKEPYTIRSTEPVNEVIELVR